MINILSYVGMSLQSEVCLWSLLGLVRTIFDATLFKVNANLKQVWQMSMPEELSRPVQRALRTMISGVMLVQCFTVYVYLASYIVLLYPVFLEERPTLVLPWLLLAAIRKLLCELTSLALGLGTCVLLGPARPPCIKFVVIKVISIMPSFYMWMLLYTYYHVLKVASVFKTFPVVLPPSERDYGLELAIRRRKTKSLLGEQQLRTNLIANLYTERHKIPSTDVGNLKPDYSSRMTHSTDTSWEDIKDEANLIQPTSATSNPTIPDTLSCEDWYGSDIMMFRNTDRVLEQIGLMMLRIGANLTREGAGSNTQVLNSDSTNLDSRKGKLESTAQPPDDTETPPLVGSSKGKTASYLRDYPTIFMRKTSDIPLTSDITLTLASDDRANPPQRQGSEAQNHNTDLKSISSRISEENASLLSHKINTKDTTQNMNAKDTTEKKLHRRSSEKSVTFKEMKHKQGVNINERDNLQSITEKMEATGSKRDKSLNKDKNNYETQDASTSQPQIKSDAKTKASNTTVVTHEAETNTPKNSTATKSKVKKTHKGDENETKK